MERGTAATTFQRMSFVAKPSPVSATAELLLNLRMAGNPSNTVAWAEVYFRTKWRLHPSRRLATIDMGQKLGGGAVPFLLG